MVCGVLYGMLLITPSMRNVFAVLMATALLALPWGQVIASSHTGECSSVPVESCCDTGASTQALTCSHCDALASESSTPASDPGCPSCPGCSCCVLAVAPVMAVVESQAVEPLTYEPHVYLAVAPEYLIGHPERPPVPPPRCS